MNWRRGFLRLWLVAAALWVLAAGAALYAAGNLTFYPPTPVEVTFSTAEVQALATGNYQRCFDLRRAAGADPLACDPSQRPGCIDPSPTRHCTIIEHPFSLDRMAAHMPVLVLPPLAALLLGMAVGWALQGFKRGS